MILKVQRSLFPPNGPMMVYDTARTVLFFIPPTEDHLKLFGHKAKIYVEGAVAGPADNAKLTIEKVLEDQPW